MDEFMMRLRVPEMTLRDYFAAKVLGGLFSNPEVDIDDLASTAEYCYEMADAMLTERDSIR